jgi:hypothetical protein
MKGKVMRIIDQLVDFEAKERGRCQPIAGFDEHTEPVDECYRSIAALVRSWDEVPESRVRCVRFGA